MGRKPLLPAALATALRRRADARGCTLPGRCQQACEFAAAMRGVLHVGGALSAAAAQRCVCCVCVSVRPRTRVRRSERRSDPTARVAFPSTAAEVAAAAKSVASSATASAAAVACSAAAAGRRRWQCGACVVGPRPPRSRAGRRARAGAGTPASRPRGAHTLSARAARPPATCRTRTHIVGARCHRLVRARARARPRGAAARPPHAACGAARSRPDPHRARPRSAPHTMADAVRPPGEPIRHMVLCLRRADAPRVRRQRHRRPALPARPALDARGRGPRVGLLQRGARQRGGLIWVEFSSEL
jgi:hypothetical protein